jgi:peptidoglycan/xylan/chitin deacetylase (PgdA/CDA1 family)
MDGRSGGTERRTVVRRRPFVLMAAAALMLGALPAGTAYGQAFQPQPPADAPVRQSACRPSTPAVEKTPGLSVDVRKGPTECNAISLSFDAGADRGYAEQILDILRDETVPASFGMTGLWAQQNNDLVQRMVDEGHELINHTWDHSSFTGYSAGRPMSVAERRLELDRTEELLVGLTGKTTRPLFRPPYGDLDNGVLKDVADDGYDYTIMWTVDSFGWNHLPAAGIVERCLSRAEPGAIILFHVGIESEDALALRTIIATLRERGYQLVTVSDLLGL